MRWDCTTSDPTPTAHGKHHEVAAAHRPHEHQEEEERQEEAVRLPRVEEELAAHRPAHDRGHEHREHAEHRRRPAGTRRARSRRPPRSSGARRRPRRPSPVPKTRTGTAYRSQRSGPGLLTFLPTVSDAEVQVPSSGMCRVNTSQARIPKNALSPIGSQSSSIARPVATTIGQRGRRRSHRRTTPSRSRSDCRARRSGRDASGTRRA